MAAAAGTWFDSFVAETRSELTGYLRRMLPTPDDALEVAQEAYLKVYVALRGSDEKRHSPRALLYTTARNLAISRLRHERVVERSAVAVRVDQELSAGRPGPERGARTQQDWQTLVEVINTLPPKRRVVMWLRLAEGLSQKDIAGRLGIAVSTVEKHLASGLRQCREAMLELGRDAAEAAPAGALPRVKAS